MHLYYHVGNQQYFINICEKMQNYMEDHVVLMGDFNQVLDPILDSKGGKLKTKMTQSVQVINEF